jgi:hypothetical protein
MELNKTIIIPTDSKQLARELFNSVVYEEDTLVLVVLGEDEKATKAVKGADRMAQIVIQGYKRKVIWIRDRAVLADEIKALKPGDADISQTDLKNVVGFSVSLAETVMDIIGTDADINILRMEMAFLNACRA